MLPSVFLLIPVLLPVLAGITLFVIPHPGKTFRNIFTFLVAIANLAAVVLIFIYGCDSELVLVRFNRDYTFSLKPDSFGKLFALLTSSLWPLSLLYGYEYMEHEDRQNSFFAFYIMTLGAVMGIAFAEDILSMYLFYEILTLVTFPLVMHTMTKEALKAGRVYLCYSLGGAAFAFIGIIFIMNYGSSLNFIYGGVLGGADPAVKGLLIFAFVITFCGFSVKAAMMPFGLWLIRAAVAPTPVTALLHAVAVVKAGAFAVIRTIYYIYGADYMRGTWGQYLVEILAISTILFGSIMSVKEQHLKRRLAYSTLSNLSYILFGAALMTPMGLTGSVTHLVAHAVTKIGMFYCIGAVMHMTGKNYIYEIDGIGHRMKKTFAIFTILSLSLAGIPQLAGFISKIKLLEGALNADTALGYIGVFAIIFSAILTIIYLFTIIVRAYFPEDGKVCDRYDECFDPGWRMIVPLVIFTVAAVAIGIFWQPVVNYINSFVI